MRPSSTSVGCLLAYVAALAFARDIGWTWG
jgi:hypothetical protein